MLPGVVSADLNFASGTLLVEFEPSRDPRALVPRTVMASGHSVEPLQNALPEGAVAEAATGPSWWTLNRTLVAVVGSGNVACLDARDVVDVHVRCH